MKVMGSRGSHYILSIVKSLPFQTTKTTRAVCCKLLWLHIFSTQALQRFLGRFLTLLPAGNLDVDPTKRITTFLPMTDPWDERYIFLHGWVIFMANVGKCTVRPMDPMGESVRRSNTRCRIYYWHHGSSATIFRMLDYLRSPDHHAFSEVSHFA